MIGKNKIENKMEDEGIMDKMLRDMGACPTAKLSGDEQEWLGIWHAGQVIKEVLQKDLTGDPFYPARKIEAMNELLRGIEDMKRRFQDCYKEYVVGKRV